MATATAPPPDVSIFDHNSILRGTLGRPGRSLEDNLRRAGFQVDSGLRWATAKGVKVVVLLFFSDRLFDLIYSLSFFSTLMPWRIPAIPVFMYTGPIHFQDATLSRRLAVAYPIFPMRCEVFRWLSTLPRYELARYNGNKVEMLRDVCYAASKLVNESKNEHRALYTKQISVLKEAEAKCSRLAREFAVPRLKLLAGELLKHGIDNVCPPSYSSGTNRLSLRFKSKVQHSMVRDIAATLSMPVKEFADIADRCIDARNEASHFLRDKNWRKHCYEAIRLIKMFPSLETECPDQVTIIRAHRKIVRNFGLRWS